MDDKISDAIQEIWKGESVQNILKIISVNVWNQIGFARNRRGLKVFETTVTQDLLRFVFMAASESHFGIQLYEANSEKANGNDIECFIETQKGYLLLPMQAKIIYENMKYPKIDHKVGNDEQIDLLINYASKKKGFPIYLLYNYFYNELLIENLKKTTNIPLELYGISYLDAFYLKNNFYNKRINKKGNKVWKIPKFEDLHPLRAKPFYEILNDNYLSSDGDEFIKQNFGDSGLELDIKLYTKEELINDNYWIDLAPLPQIGKLPPGIDRKKWIRGYASQNIEFNTFDPKFRIILTSKKTEKKVKISYLS